MGDVKQMGGVERAKGRAGGTGGSKGKKRQEKDKDPWVRKIRIGRELKENGVKGGKKGELKKKVKLVGE